MKELKSFSEYYKEVDGDEEWDWNVEEKVETEEINIQDVQNAIDSGELVLEETYECDECELTFEVKSLFEEHVN